MRITLNSQAEIPPFVDFALFSPFRVLLFGVTVDVQCTAEYIESERCCLRKKQAVSACFLGKELLTAKESEARTADY